MYRVSPLSTISLSTILNRIKQYKFPNIVQFFAFFLKKNLSKSTFYVLSTSPRLVRFLNCTIPWEPKTRTIRGPPVSCPLGLKALNILQNILGCNFISFLSSMFYSYVVLHLGRAELYGFVQYVQYARASFPLQRDHPHTTSPLRDVLDNSREHP